LDVTGFQYAPVRDFGVRGVEPSASASTVLENIMECNIPRGGNLDTQNISDIG
jgi:hypothetical protein